MFPSWMYNVHMYVENIISAFKFENNSYENYF